MTVTMTEMMTLMDNKVQYKKKILESLGQLK